METGSVNFYRLIQLVSRAGNQRVDYPDLGDCPAFDAACVLGAIGVGLFAVCVVWWLFREPQ